MFNKIFICIIFLICYSILFSANRGTVGGLFLDLLPTARSIGMGGAVSGITNGAEALHFNPAATVYSLEPEFYFTHQILYQDLKYYYFAYLTQIDNYTAMGFNIKNLTISDIEKTTVNRGNRYNYFLNGSYEMQDICLSYSIAHKIKKSLNISENQYFIVSYGGSIKYIVSKIDTYKAKTYTTDWSLFLKGKGINLNFMITNLFGSLKYNKKKEDLSLSFKMGIGVPFEIKEHNTNLGIEITKIVGDNLYFNTGLEFEINKNLILRTGRDFRNDANNSLSFGIGYKIPYDLKYIKNLMINYAFSTYGDLGDKHAFDLSIKF
ncbi:MAG TPA: PorV/PorQ family protein [bacterium]|nr:PorV/PorQ family protein [bacterium]HPQ18604.1 PorV/PorQ family protein [bacterium]